MSLVENDDVLIFLIDQLGGDGRRAYSRERKTKYKHMVAEIFSPPRVTSYLSKYPNEYLVPGFALDLTCMDPHDNMPWDFDRKDKRERALAMVRRDKPLFLVGSPACTAWCTWQRLNNLERPGDCQ